MSDLALRFNRGTNVVGRFIVQKNGDVTFPDRTRCDSLRVTNTKSDEWSCYWDPNPEKTIADPFDCRVSQYFITNGIRGAGSTSAYLPRFMLPVAV